MHRAFATLRAIREQRDHVCQSEKNRLERIDFLRFQLAEVENSDLQLGEDLELEKEFKRLNAAGE